MKKFDRREFRNLPKMVKTYLSEPRKNDLKLRKLDKIDFMSFIYNLDTDKYGISGFSNKSFLRNIGINPEKESNWVLDIINRIYYGSSEFIDEMETQTSPRDKNDVLLETGDIIEVPKYGELKISNMEYNTLFDKNFYWSIVFENQNGIPERLNDFDFSKSEIVKKVDNGDMIPEL